VLILSDFTSHRDLLSPVSFASQLACVRRRFGPVGLAQGLGHHGGDIGLRLGCRHCSREGRHTSRSPRSSTQLSDFESRGRTLPHHAHYSSPGRSSINRAAEFQLTIRQPHRQLAVRRVIEIAPRSISGRLKGRQPKIMGRGSY